MSAPIVVVDYHKGNLLSVARGLAEVGGEAEVTDDPTRIAEAAGVVLPGVGAFEDAMAYLRQSGQDEAILSAIGRGVPFLGICLGLQLLFERGDERCDGALHGPDDPERWAAGLGVLPGSVSRLRGRLKVPHVGWDQVHLTPHGRVCPLLRGVPEGANAYFTHSYALDEDVDPLVVTCRTHYVRSFASAVWRDNVYGVQFHPEKSSAVGLTHPQELRGPRARGWKMILFPAIDLVGGRVVRLQRGDRSKMDVYSDDPASVARDFAAAGAEWIHVVDLSATFEEDEEACAANAAAIRAICQVPGVSVDCGGGVRSMAAVSRLADLGVRRIAIGTALVRDPAFAERAAAEFGELLVADVAAKDGVVKVNGWREGEKVSLSELVSRLSGLGYRHLVFTDINRDGMQPAST